MRLQMDAFFARNRLSAYLDGVLEDSEAAEVAAAIEADPALRGEYEAMRQVIDLLRTHGPAEAPEGFHARLMARVDQEPVPGGAVVWLRQRFAQVPVEALALAAAALVVVIVIQGRPGEDPLASSEAPSEETAASAPELSEPPSSKEALPSAKVEEPEVLAKADPVEEMPAGSKKLQQPVKPDKAAAQKVVSKKVASKEAFVPEWDVDAEDPEGTAETIVQAETDGSNAGLSRPQGYRISLSHPRVLYDLSSVAEQAGGRMIDASGRQLNPRALTYEDNYAQVHLAVPADQLSVVQKSLRKLGAVECPPPGTTPLYGPSQVGFVIDVHYMP